MVFPQWSDFGCGVDCNTHNTQSVYRHMKGLRETARFAGEISLHRGVIR